MSSEDLEGHRYSVEYQPEIALVVVHEIVSPAARGPVLAARGRWTKDHVSWELNRLGPGKAATVASVLAPHLVVADDSMGARSGWEGPCPVCARAGTIPPRVIRATFGEALRGGTARCAEGHWVRIDDQDGRVARNIFLINDLFARVTPSGPASVDGRPKQPGPFRVAKMFDRGTDSPIVQRLVLQFFAVLESAALTLDPKTINGVKELLLETMRDLGHVQDAVDAYVRREDESIAGLTGGGVRITHNAVYYDDPTVDLRKLFGDALTSTVIALRNLPRLAGAILGAELDDAKSWKKLRPLLTAAASRQDPGSTVVDDFYRWSDELAAIRGRFEHPHPPLEITSLQVEVDGGTLKGIHPPRLVQPPVSLRNLLEPIVPDAIDYSERLIALLFGERCAKGYKIERYPPGDGSAFQFAPLKTG
jgi:hypothetical protein